MDNEVIITAEGKAALEAELEELKLVKRPEIVEAIKEAKAQGDLSENYEYTAAKEAQGDLEARISEIEHILDHAKVVDSSELDNKVVNIGSTVTVVEDGEDEEETYSIVGPTEADPIEGKISNESPLGKAMLGKKKNSLVQFTTPTGATITYKIKKIK
ncbi:MAG: transcription elongation factor GreA [Clostridia bacterium]|nr:transcription elongation factor GreA [Clostridia bacterium]